MSPSGACSSFTQQGPNACLISVTAYNQASKVTILPILKRTCCWIMHSLKTILELSLTATDAGVWHYYTYANKHFIPVVTGSTERNKITFCIWNYNISWGKVSSNSWKEKEQCKGSSDRKFKRNNRKH